MGTVPVRVWERANDFGPLWAFRSFLVILENMYRRTLTQDVATKKLGLVLVQLPKQQPSKMPQPQEDTEGRWNGQVDTDGEKIKIHAYLSDII